MKKKNVISLLKAESRDIKLAILNNSNLLTFPDLRRRGGGGGGGARDRLKLLIKITKPNFD